MDPFSKNNFSKYCLSFSELSSYLNNTLLNNYFVSFNKPFNEQIFNFIFTYKV